MNKNPLQKTLLEAVIGDLLLNKSPKVNKQDLDLPPPLQPQCNKIKNKIKMMVKVVTEARKGILTRKTKTMHRVVEVGVNHLTKGTTKTEKAPTRKRKMIRPLHQMMKRMMAMKTKRMKATRKKISLQKKMVQRS